MAGRTGVRMTHHPRFAEQFQLDPDEQTRDAVFEEIRDGLKLLIAGSVAALLFLWAVL